MNERIKELAEQARIQMCSDARLQEFAELIIQDLAKKVGETGTQCAYTTHDLNTVQCTIAMCKSVVENYLKENL